ncbi:acetoacetate--CoA ligase [Aeromicrobium sp. 9AM]|uniref:acetoacetate--CoA ligase n=1 Tax=Aeromicrobium sp. 9AM TaxID=2653126 RepID=UPI0012EEE777|nr:acetoacetate--CoA ligase [Aeromicrobium sp. 9AM]VXB14600.1 Acetoacetyl-coenzyme A synthetase [Aeromicrobium sp. 9AM]
MTETPELLWSPDPSRSKEHHVEKFISWLSETRDVQVGDWDGLWDWSVSEPGAFWAAIWDYFGVTSHAPVTGNLEPGVMPDVSWFPGARLNYSEHLLRDTLGDHTVAVVAHSQTRPEHSLTFDQLHHEVAKVRQGLERLGVGRGDRVVAYLPNIPETLVAFLATASLGAVWASCAPEFGAQSVIDRFEQLQPKVLLTIAGYRYGDKEIDRTEQCVQIIAALPSLSAVVHVPYLGEGPAGSISWADLVGTADAAPALQFEPVPFDHPLFVLFSSGTTGKPKAIVHGHGGILLEHLKNHTLSWDLGRDDRMMWFSTTAWMMWNMLASTLLTKASIVMFDGNPMFPDVSEQWRIAGACDVTMFGCSPGLLMSSREHDLRPREEHGLWRLRQVAVAGSPLPAEGYRWVAEQFGDDVLLNVGSGGTDLCAGIVQGSPVQPVWVNEISGACLGVAAKAYDELGRQVVGERGELVITVPMPSMPVGFWGDDDGSKYRAAYFETYPGVWRHGDWIRFTDRGSCVVIGRSDATLNRGGVRLGTAEFYGVLESLPAVGDSLVVHLEDSSGGMGELMLFVVPAIGHEISTESHADIRRELRNQLSPRHVPDTITVVPSIPINRTGKKLEVPVKRILLGEPVDAVMSLDVLADPTSIDAFVAAAAQRSGR